MATTKYRLDKAIEALWAIANMQIQDTDHAEVLALCMSIARIELENQGFLDKE